MSVGPEQDAPRPAQGDGFSDAVTVAFADGAAELYGVARLGLSAGAASGLAILFRGGEPVVVSAEGGVELSSPPSSWDEVSAAGLDLTTVEPLRAWRLQFAGDEAAFDLELEAIGAVAELDSGHDVARAGGIAGYEQPVRVRGSATVGDERIAIDGLGQRGRSWGAPDWDRIELARTVSAWLDDDLAVVGGRQTRIGDVDRSRLAVLAALDDGGGHRLDRVVALAGRADRGE